jgi:hypothetical protein
MHRCTSLLFGIEHLPGFVSVYFPCYNPVSYLPFWESVMNAGEQKRMQELCSAIAQEQDSDTLLGLVAELNQLFELKELRLKEKEAGLRSSDPSAKLFSA